jgi:hypothetical protein
VFVAWWAERGFQTALDPAAQATAVGAGRITCGCRRPRPPSQRAPPTTPVASSWPPRRLAAGVTKTALARPLNIAADGVLAWRHCWRSRRQA